MEGGKPKSACITPGTAGGNFGAKGTTPSLPGGKPKSAISTRSTSGKKVGGGLTRGMGGKRNHQSIGSWVSLRGQSEHTSKPAQQSFLQMGLGLDESRKGTKRCHFEEMSGGDPTDVHHPCRG